MRKINAVFCFLVCLFLTTLLVQAQDTILIKNGKIIPVVGDPISNGSVLIQKGKIVKIGVNISAPADAKVIDAKGMYVYPGMVAPLTAVGVTGYPGAGSDTDEIGVSTPHMDVYDALNPEDECIEVTRIDGVTTVMTVAGTRKVINGNAVVLNLEGNLAEDMVMKRYAVQIFNMGAKTQGKYPSTFMGVNSLIRDKLNQAQTYVEKQEKSQQQGEKKKDQKEDIPEKRNLEMEALAPVVMGKVPALFITSDEVQIRNALEIIKEYKLKGILFASVGVLKYVQILAAEKIPVIWGGTNTIPQRWEPFDLNYHTAAGLAAHGVLFAFNESNRGPGSRNVRRQPVPASLSVAYGLSEEDAIKAITINPAKILGIDDQVGSLEPGKIANVIICSKSLIQLSSKIHTVIIKGKIIPMTSVQTRLRDKYNKVVRERIQKK